jgi:hypothetical protein
MRSELSQRSWGQQRQHGRDRARCQQQKSRQLDSAGSCSVCRALQEHAGQPPQQRETNQIDAQSGAPERAKQLTLPQQLRQLCAQARSAEHVRDRSDHD